MKNACEQKRPLGIPRRRWEDNIKMDTKEIRCEDWYEFFWLRIGTRDGIL
jgi:hypothetical protein